MELYVNQVHGGECVPDGAGAARVCPRCGGTRLEWFEEGLYNRHTFYWWCYDCLLPFVLFKVRRDG